MSSVLAQGETMEVMEPAGAREKFFVGSSPFDNIKKPNILQGQT